MKKTILGSGGVPPNDKDNELKNEHASSAKSRSLTDMSKRSALLSVELNHSAVFYVLKELKGHVSGVANHSNLALTHKLAKPALRDVHTIWETLHAGGQDHSTRNGRGASSLTLLAILGSGLKVRATSFSIALLWNKNSAGRYYLKRMSTTSTVYVMTTALKTLSYGLNHSQQALGQAQLIAKLAPVLLRPSLLGAN